MPELFSGSCFHEPSNPQPRANVFWGLARRTAYALVGHEPEGAAEAVAREAFCRVLQREPPTRSPPTYDLSRTMRRQPCQASLSDRNLASYANQVDLQLAWNRARPGMRSAGGHWVNYEADPAFVDWISSYHWKWRLGFQHRHVPLGSEQGCPPLLSIPELAPMPDDVLRSYFKSCKWQPRSSEEGRRASVPAHLVAQTCQRLLAYHSARNAVFVQYHVIRLLRLLRKRHGRPEFIWDPAGYFDALAEGPLVVESATPEVWLRHFVPEARKVIEMATIAMATPEAAWRKLKGLLPNRSVCNALAADAV